MKATPPDKLRSAVERGEPAALAEAEKLLHSEKRFAGDRELALLVVGRRELHEEFQSLVLYAMRFLASLGDEVAFRAIVPLAPRSWDDGWLDYGGSPFADRATVTADYLEAHPELGNDEENDRVGEMIGDVFTDASPAVRERLRGIATRFFRSSKATNVRRGVACALVDVMNDKSVIWELTELPDDDLRSTGFSLAFTHAREELVSRYGHLADSALRKGAADAARFAALELLFKQEPFALVPHEGRIAVAWGNGRTITYGWLDLESKRLTSFRHRLDGGAHERLVRIQLALPKKFAGRVLHAAYRFSFGTEGSVYFHEGEGGERLVAKTQDEVGGQLGRRMREKAPPKPAKPKAPAKVAKPTKPSKYLVKVVGKQASSSKGKVSVSGEELVALFDGATGKKLFAPPDSIAIALTDRHLLSWRMTKRSGVSGIGRGDYDWTLDKFEWPEKKLVASYTLTSRKVIEWCWPLGLRCPKSHRYRIAAFDCRSEDWKDCVYVVMHDDGRFTETNDLASAVSASKGSS